MKKKSLLMMVLALTAALCSCERTESQEEVESMSLTPDTLVFDAKGVLTDTVEVISNRAWKAMGIPEWAVMTVDGQNIDGRLFPASESPVTVTVDVVKNEGKDERNADILFNCGPVACKTLHIRQAGYTVPFTTIAEVRAMNTDPNATTIAEEGTVIRGYVISNKSLDNLNSLKSFVIQDSTGGMSVYCQTDHNLDFGDEVSIDLSGATLEYYAMLFEAGNLNVKNITLISKGGTVDPIRVPVKDFKANKYESRYIEIEEDVQVSEGSLGRTWVMGGSSTNIDMVASDGTTFVVHSSKYSSFGGETVPQGAGKIRGIASIYNDGMQLVFAQDSDWTGLSAERFSIDVPKVESDRISVITGASAGAEVTLRNAVVVATSLTDIKNPASSFLVRDAEGDHLFVYHADLSPQVGDVVTVKGNLSSYGVTPMPQITDPSVTVHYSGSEVKYPEPEDITADVDGFSSDVVRLVSIVGTYRCNDQYHEITVEGADRCFAFLKPDVIDVEPFENVPNTRFTGYYLYTNRMYPYIMLVRVEPDGGEFVEVNPSDQTVAACDTDAYITVSSNSTWTCESKTDGFSVDRTSGSGNATVKVSFGENPDSNISRTAEIEFRCGSAVKTVTVTQKNVCGTNTVNLTFPDDNSANNMISAYNRTWKAISGDMSFSISSFNNNKWKNSWKYIKCGSMNYESVACITTDDPFAAAVSKITVTVDRFTADMVNGSRLEISPRKDFSSDVQTVDVSISQGDVAYVVPEPDANLYYRLSFDCAQGSYNGLIQISKVTYEVK